MKTVLFTLFLTVMLVSAFSQNLKYDVRGKYIHPVTREKIENARTMGDIIPDYPASWILGYVSVGISTKHDGFSFEARGIDDRLNAGQINLLNSAGPGTDIVVSIRYKSLNNFTNVIEERTMNYTATVVPETQAEYPYGYAQLTQYLKENAIDRISEADSKDLQQAVVQFTVNEAGEIADARLTKTSGDPGVDNLLLQVIHDMPKWKPAEDSKGTRVKQEFVFTVGNNEGC